MHTAEKKGGIPITGGPPKRFIIPYMLHFVHCSASCAPKTSFLFTRHYIVFSNTIEKF